MKIRTLAVLPLVLLAACPEKKAEAPLHRAELHQLTGNTLEIVPAPGQLPYCLLYTLSRKGVIRQLTMNRLNRSIPCQANQPIGGVAYRIPVDEGPVRLLLLFSDQQLHAGPIAQEIYERNASSPNFSLLDLRLPGQVNSEVLDFTPGTEMPTQVGGVVGKSGEANGRDAGTPGPDGGTQPAGAGTTTP